MRQYYFHAGKMPNMLRPVDVSTAFDRTRILFDVPEIEPVAPIGVYGQFREFDQICDERAAQIVASVRKSGKRLAVYWSGGIDSTLALVALRKHEVDDMLTVVLNDYSVIEYPWYFEKLRHSGVAFEWVQRPDVIDHVPLMLVEHYIVTGEIGDQVFGSVKYKSFPDYSILMEPWQSFIQTNSNEMKERYERFVAACPAPVTTVKEFWWWMSYAIKYQGVCFRMLGQAKDARLEGNVFHFFHSPAINDWAVSAPMELKFPGIDERRYKQPAKEYIYRETKDADYRDNKTKEISLTTISSAKGRPNIQWVATDWSKG